MREEIVESGFWNIAITVLLCFCNVEYEQWSNIATPCEVLFQVLDNSCKIVQCLYPTTNKITYMLQRI